MMQHAFPSTHNGRPGWIIEIDYEAETVEELKAKVPHTDRAWNPDKKRWWIAQEYEDVLEEMWPYFTVFRDQPRLL